jgi:hypothetical protein
MVSCPAFTGEFVMTAFGAKGEVLGSQVVEGDWTTSHPRLGVPFTEIAGPIEVECCAGEFVTIASEVFQPEGVEFTWFADGVEISGQSGSSLFWQAPREGSSIVHAIAANECGTREIGPFVLQPVPSASGGYPELLYVARFAAGSGYPVEFVACAFCGSNEWSTSEEGSAFVAGFQFSNGSISVGMGGGLGGAIYSSSEGVVRFRLERATLITVMGSCPSGSECTAIGGELRGPDGTLQLSELSANCGRGAGTRFLLSGEYEISVRSKTFNPCWLCSIGCQDCGPSAYEACSCPGETQAWAGTITFEDACDRLDLNADGVVSAGDFATLLTAWGTGGADGTDLDGDGVVDARDIALLLAGWGPCE